MMQNNPMKFPALAAACLVAMTAARAQTNIPISNASFESGGFGDYYGPDYLVIPPAIPLETLVCGCAQLTRQTHLLGNAARHLSGHDHLHRHDGRRRAR